MNCRGAAGTSFTNGYGVAYLGNAQAMRTMLDRGADVNTLDPPGHSALMYAAVSDLLPLDA